MDGPKALGAPRASVPEESLKSRGAQGMGEGTALPTQVDFAHPTVKTHGPYLKQ